MREIKFRGKRKDNNEWVYGCLIVENPSLQCFKSENVEPDKYLIGKSGFADWNMPRPFTAAEVTSESVGQYTGLKDKNGEEIYEGDILDFDEKEWGGKFTPEVISYEKLIDWNIRGTFDDISNYRTVIGNLFDNPELIKQ